ncbi:MAG: hypothetical protein EYC70_04840 [Planctomycetota bacterium]|nr:MAG: hypothetical protein EYC70_04840 [Planctomycetota bacterium]
MLRGAAGLCLALPCLCAAWCGCAASNAPPLLRVRAEAGLEAAGAIERWALSDVGLVAAAVGRPVPTQPLEIVCGSAAEEGGELRLRAGENARHVRRGGDACLILLAAAPDAALRTSLRHELVHHVLEDQGYAEWLNEGLAEHVAYILAASPSRDDVHQLFHAGLVLAGWGRPLQVRNRDGDSRALEPLLWLPDLPQTLRMNHAEYERLVLNSAADQDPEFHAASHLLTAALFARGGTGADAAYMRRLHAGADPWQAYLDVTGCRDREQVLDALVAQLRVLIEDAPQAERASREFVRSPCLWSKLPSEWGRLRAAQAYPGGPEIALRRSAAPSGL